MPTQVDNPPNPPEGSSLRKRKLGPAYVRGRKGVVHTYVGPEILADASAAGDIRKEPLYTVRFEAAALWPEAILRRAAVYLDLWESYLESA